MQASAFQKIFHVALFLSILVCLCNSFGMISSAWSFQENSANAEASERDLSGGEVELASSVETQSTDGSLSVFWRPLLAMIVGVSVVLALMIGLKTHAFLALILGSLVISCFVPLDVVGVDSKNDSVKVDDKDPKRIVSRVANELGVAVSKIGILIAMASIIGKCMLDSGSADRIVQSILSVLGEKRAGLAMMLSAFVLGIPVFFDTVFFLLVPLARSLYKTTGKNYVKYLMAVAAGGAITHTLVPPTPGPLAVADNLAAPGNIVIDLGTVIVIGLMIGFPSAVVGLLFSGWVDKKMPIEMRPLSGRDADAEADDACTRVLPSLWIAILPVFLPVFLITLATIVSLPIWQVAGQPSSAWVGWIKLIGDPSFAMIFAAITAITISGAVQNRSLKQLANDVDDALLSGGVIILITAAGGAFGAMLRMAQINQVVVQFFESQAASGLLLLVTAYCLSALLKVAQGSSTVAMIIASSLVAPIISQLGVESLGFHPAYFVPIIGAGSLMGSWMNDSGFWVFAKMGGLTESETLRSWTLLLAVLSLSGLFFGILLALVMPMQIVPA